MFYRPYYFYEFTLINTCYYSFYNTFLSYSLLSQDGQDFTKLILGVVCLKRPVKPVKYFYCPSMGFQRFLLHFEEGFFLSWTNLPFSLPLVFRNLDKVVWLSALHLTITRVQNYIVFIVRLKSIDR